MFKVPIDYQCAILVFHAASHPQCEQLPRNARQVARVARRGPARGERRADAWLPIGNRTTKGSSEIPACDAAPDPGISQIRIRGDRATASGTIEALADEEARTKALLRFVRKRG